MYFRDSLPFGNISPIWYQISCSKLKLTCDIHMNYLAWLTACNNFWLFQCSLEQLFLTHEEDQEYTMQDCFLRLMQLEAYKLIEQSFVRFHDQVRN